MIRNIKKLYCLSTHQHNHSTHPKGSQDTAYTLCNRNNFLPQVGTGRAPRNKKDVQLWSFKSLSLKLLIFCSKKLHDVCIYSDLFLTQFFYQRSLTIYRNITIYNVKKIYIFFGHIQWTHCGCFYIILKQNILLCNPLLYPHIALKNNSV